MTHRTHSRVMIYSGQRTFLLLQGPPGPFARELGNALRARGHRVLRVNLCLGDWLDWHGAGTACYRGAFEGWPQWLDDFVRRERVTEILYYADQHPYHRVAREVSERRGIPAYVYEFGYLRPSFITFERGGMSTGSHLPDDPQYIRALDDGSLADPDFSNAYPHVFVAEASREVLYNLSSWLSRPLLFPGYVSDRLYSPLREYLSHVPRLISRRWLERDANVIIESLAKCRTPYWLLPLQLETDYQLRRHSRFAHMREAVEHVVDSFARHAPPAHHLIVKLHPLQCGVVPWRQVVGDIARALEVEDRVRSIDGGSLERLLRHASGTVLVNSTVGVHALRYACPVKALGVAIFDIKGLTFQGSLDAFWREATPPDPDLCQSFLRVVAATTQVKGSFYNRAGRARAIEQIIERLLARRVNEPGAFVEPPPRQARALAAGVPV